ncbi:CBS domain-containing protein [Desulfosarcina ovata]|uniref:Membrane protein n=2 Tax=Desulfosarcina ovata TaxID=83564 RepID=A0A5K8AEI2_9BACT|nr:CBS domain-containing protein [Desulfosarcina ovata]BBO83901.1 membrane protein [Desulfosarcina ovata subsp. sediminis]BBO90394.1 membrane protein [Desulfosarcina ovata subsp. ovata]
MFISQFMTTPVVTIDPQADVARARSLMIHHRCRHLPVTGPDNVLLGMVSDRDLRSALGSTYFHEFDTADNGAAVKTAVRVRDVMTRDPIRLSAVSTIQDALLLMEKSRVGAFPVVDDGRTVIGIISDRDLLNAFVQVLGIKEPGALLGIVMDEKIEAMGKIVNVMISEKVPFGSILVYRNWRPGKWAVFPYLLAMNISHLKEKLRDMGFELIDPGDGDAGQWR